MFLQSASNSEIYYKAISSKYIVNGNDKYNIKSLIFVIKCNKQLGA